MVTPTTLPDGFGGLVVDAAHSQVFVSSPTSGTITALDFSGTILGTITDEPGPGSMVVQGDKLYVALLNGGAIDVFDTATRARTATLGSGQLVQPGSLVFAGGKLWTSTGACVSGAVAAGVGRSRPPVTCIRGSPTARPASRTASTLVGSGWDPDALAGVEPWDHIGDPVTRFDVGSGEPGLAVVSLNDGQLGNLKDLAVTPDGTRFVAASGWPYQINEYQMSDLTADGIVYPSGPYPDAVATTAAQGGLVAAGRDAGYDNDVDVYRARTTGRETALARLRAERQRLFAGSGVQPRRYEAVRGHRFWLDDGALPGARPRYPGDGNANGELTPLTPARLLEHADRHWREAGQARPG